MPITSLTWTSRQARTHRPHWMQESRLTRIAGWLASPCQRSAAGKRLSVTSTFSAQCQNFESGSCEVSRAGWSATSSSITIFCAATARALVVLTFMPTLGVRLAEAADRRIAHRLAQFVQQLPVPDRPFHQQCRLLGADPARRALAAAFIL